MTSSVGAGASVARDGERDLKRMPVQMVSAPVRPGRRAFAPMCASLLALALGSAAFAQQPAPPAPQPKAAPQQPKAQAPKAAPKQQPPAQQAAPPAQPQQQASSDMTVIHSPWVKVCGKDQQPGAKETCLTIMEARLENGQFLAGAMFIEPENEPKKLLRITLPLGMQIPQGTRVILDQEQPISGRYLACLPNGCMADFEVDGAFVGKVKKGQSIILQGINLYGQTASYPLPLAEFAKANEGPATDPKAFQENHQKLQDELQKRGEQMRERLQKQNGGAAPSR
jgi:invasion protein IalB